MSDYFTISGSQIKDKEVTADELWDEIDLTSNDQLTIFTDCSVSCNLETHVPDVDSDYHTVNSFGLDAGGDVVILTGNYTSLKFSVDTDNTLTAFYEEG